MLSTAFDPSQHGFHFSNNDIEWEIHAGGPGGKNLCGGMVYAALDSFLYRRAIPPDSKPPAKRSPLNDYIYRRQVAAHLRTVPRLTGETALFDLFSSDNWFVNSVAGEFDKIRNQVERYYPVPLFLVRSGVLRGHHVLVIACQSSPSLGNPILKIYDPNTPNTVSTLSVEYRMKRFTNSGTGGMGEWRGFFVDEGYSAKQPPW